MKERINLSSPHMSVEGYEKKYVNMAFKTNWIAPVGPNINSFEKEFGEMISSSNVVALSSGTASIHLALKVAGIKSGDLVACQSLTFAATANPIIYVGANPVFIGSDRETWNMSVEYLKEALEKNRNIKAVIVVHLYGIPARIIKIKELCELHNVILIEDAAESLGTLINGKHTGTFGDYGIFSFNGNKIITTSGGGILISSNKEKIEKAKFLSTQAKEPVNYYYHKEIGYNYRMSNVSAGIGRGQLKVLDRRVLKKQEIFNYYVTNLNNKYFTPMPSIDNCISNYWLSTFILNEFKPSDIIEVLAKNNIEARHIWKPLHTQPVFEKCDFYGSGYCVELFKNGISLPSDTKLDDNDLKRIVRIINSFIDEKSDLNE